MTRARALETGRATPDSRATTATASPFRRESAAGPAIPTVPATPTSRATAATYVWARRVRWAACALVTEDATQVSSVPTEPARCRFRAATAAPAPAGLSVTVETTPAARPTDAAVSRIS